VCFAHTCCFSLPATPLPCPVIPSLPALGLACRMLMTKHCPSVDAQAYAIRQLGDPQSGPAYIPWLPLGGGPVPTSDPSLPTTSLGSDVVLGAGASSATTIMRPFSITVIHSK
jgi:hypothetical protein